MKFITVWIISAACALSAFAQPTSKASLMSELVQLYGLDEVVADAKKAAGAQVRDAIDQMFGQVRASVPSLSPEMIRKMQVAADKMMSTVERSWTAEEALQVWQDEFAAELSVDDLAAIVAACKTPAGQKQIAAAKRASGAFQKYILEQGKGAVEAAMREYISDVQKIVAEGR